MKKVLIVEDERNLHILWREELKMIEVISAFSVGEAEEKFASTPNIAVIVMDACVPGFEPNTIHLVREFRKTFTGPIIAISSVDDYRKELKRSGCDYEAEKTQVSKKISEILNL